MTIFLQDSPEDYLMYYPIMKELDRKKKKYELIDLSNGSMNLIMFLSNHEVKSAVVAGYSPAKITAVLLLRESGIQTLAIDAHGRMVTPEDNPTDNSILRLLSAVATLNLVSSDGAARLLRDEGILGRDSRLDHPITHLASKSTKNKTKKTEIMVYVNGQVPNSVLSGVKATGKEWILYDSGSVLENPNKFYSDFYGCSYVVSDSFIFDQPTYDLGKHFFYIGDKPTSLDHLGISTHVIDTRKKEIQDYLKQSWTNPNPDRKKVGIQSLLKLL